MCVYTQGFVDLLKTWRLHTCLTEPLEDGYGVKEVYQADSVGRSFVAQYEALALKYNQKFFLRCGVSWSVQCVWIDNSHHTHLPLTILTTQDQGAVLIPFSALSLATLAAYRLTRPSNTYGARSAEQVAPAGMQRKRQ